MSTDRVSATGRIAAPASKLFQIVSSPAGHVEVDGSGMLEAAAAAQQLTAVGDIFDMDMDRAPLGDIPGLGKYKVRNTVTGIVPHRLVEWAVGGADGAQFGHVYGWQIEPVSETECEVANYCDWTNISEERRSQCAWPVVPLQMLERSVANLRRIATES